MIHFLTIATCLQVVCAYEFPHKYDDFYVDRNYRVRDAKANFEKNGRAKNQVNLDIFLGDVYDEPQQRFSYQLSHKNNGEGTIYRDSMDWTPEHTSFGNRRRDTSYRSRYEESSPHTRNDGSLDSFDGFYTNLPDGYESRNNEGFADVLKPERESFSRGDSHQHHFGSYSSRYDSEEIPFRTPPDVEKNEELLQSFIRKREENSSLPELYKLLKNLKFDFNKRGGRYSLRKSSLTSALESMDMKSLLYKLSNYRNLLQKESASNSDINPEYATDSMEGHGKSYERSIHPISGSHFEFGDAYANARNKNRYRRHPASDSERGRYEHPRERFLVRRNLDRFYDDEQSTRRRHFKKSKGKDEDSDDHHSFMVIEQPVMDHPHNVRQPTYGDDPVHNAQFDDEFNSEQHITDLMREVLKEMENSFENFGIPTSPTGAFQQPLVSKEEEELVRTVLDHPDVQQFVRRVIIRDRLKKIMKLYLQQNIMEHTKQHHHRQQPMMHYGPPQVQLIPVIRHQNSGKKKKRKRPKQKKPKFTMSKGKSKGKKGSKSRRRPVTLIYGEMPYGASHGVW